MCKLKPLLCGAINEKELKKAKAIILDAFNNCSESNESDHSQKIKRVYQTLCDFMRRLDKIISSLFEKGELTARVCAEIRAEQTVHHVVMHLLDVLSGKTDSCYQFFLVTLDSTKQHHLRCLLEKKG